MSPKSRRFWFISCSIAGHLALGVGVFASGIWRIERLDADRRSLSTLAVLSQAAPEGGSPKALPAVTLKPKPLKLVKEVTQPATLKPTVVDVAAVATVVPGDGEGEAEGPGTGTGPEGSTGTCLTPPCGVEPTPEPAKPPKPKDRVEDPLFIPPTALKLMRTGGQTQVHPPETVKTQMLREGRARSVGLLKVCISELGTVTSVDVLSSTKYPAFDARLLEAVRGWTYKPYAAQGRNVKVCGTVTFDYSIR